MIEGTVLQPVKGKNICEEQKLLVKDLCPDDKVRLYLKEEGGISVLIVSLRLCLDEFLGFTFFSPEKEVAEQPFFLSQKQQISHQLGKGAGGHSSKSSRTQTPIWSSVLVSHLHLLTKLLTALPLTGIRSETFPSDHNQGRSVPLLCISCTPSTLSKCPVLSQDF